jgi:hypothetical protein
MLPFSSLLPQSNGIFIMNSWQRMSESIPPFDNIGTWFDIITIHSLLPGGDVSFEEKYIRLDPMNQ